MDVTEAEHALTNVLTGFSTTQNYVQTLAQNMEVQATMIYTYIYIICIYLVGGLEHLDYFVHSVGNFMIPTDVQSMIFQRAQPPTRSGKIRC